MESGLSKDEQLMRAREERAIIVARYDKGREEGAVIDAWEDPNYELYHKTDRYGFIHDTRLPDVRGKDEAKRIEAEKSRSMKWAKMLSNWPKYNNTDKLFKRVYKGIPLSVRGSVWSKLLSLDIIKAQQKGKYKEMKDLGRKWSSDVRQIDLDVNRTYRDHEFFRLRYDIRQQQLFHVLVAYSVYNQEIGYCQGMSQIAALLLIYLNDEEDAFWALSALMTEEKFSMHGFFIPGFPKLMRFQKHHDKILLKFLPKLKKHLEKNYIDSGLYTLKWFFQCFLDRVPFSLTLRLWDIFLIKGEHLMITMAYTILRLHRRAIMKLDMDQILDYLQKRLEQNFGYDDDYVIEFLEKSMEELRRAKLYSPGMPSEEELPQKPFGLFIEPTLEKEVGLRTEASEKENLITKVLLQRQDKFAVNGDQLSIGKGSEFSVDEVSSFGVGGSRISLATSLTSAPDISTLSSRKFDVDNDSMRSIVSSDARSVQSAKSPIENKFRPSYKQSPPNSPTHNPINTLSVNHHSLISNYSEDPLRMLYVVDHNGIFYNNATSPGILRPSRLSVSQTTLQDPSSEPATPTASETPDTVRIFVPFNSRCNFSQSQNDLNTNPDVLSKSSSSHEDPNMIKIQIDGTTLLENNVYINSPVINNRGSPLWSTSPINIEDLDLTDGLL